MAAKTDIYEENFEQIAEGFEGGEEEVDLAAQFGVSPPTIGRWLFDAGYKHRGRGRYPIAMKTRAGILAEQGWDYDDIAKLLKVTRELVDEWSRNPVPNPSPPVKKPRISKEAQELIENPPWTRHVRGRRWTEEQKLNVLELMQGGFTPLEVFRIAGASKARQRSVWGEYGRGGHPPNLRPRARKGAGVHPEVPRGRPRQRTLAPGGRREVPQERAAPQLSRGEKRALPPTRRTALPEAD